MNLTEPAFPPRSTRPLAVRLLQRVIVGVFIFLNDRLLPSSHQIDMGAVRERVESFLSWCERFLEQHDPGPMQYRGRPLQMHTHLSSHRSPVQFRYRGLVVEHEISIPSTETGEPYIPPYQRRLHLWLLNWGMADADRLASTPDLKPAYRGQKL